MLKKLRMLTIAGVSMVALFSIAHAETININYSGVNGTQFSNGSGSITFNSAGPGATLADVSAFNFTFQTDGVANYAATLADLASFSLSSLTNPKATISLTTNPINQNPSAGWFPETFSLTGTLMSATGTVYVPTTNFVENTGIAHLTVSGVPELATLFFVASGLLGLALRRRGKAN